MVNLCLKSYTFCLHFILHLHAWILIRIGNTDPIRIRIHNTDFKQWKQLSIQWRPLPGSEGALVFLGATTLLFTEGADLLFLTLDLSSFFFLGFTTAPFSPPLGGWIGDEVTRTGPPLGG